MMSKSILSLLVQALGISCWAGGNLVGNGAGLVEHNFQYAYVTLSTAVRNCFESQECGFTERESRVLQKIQVILANNASLENRLIFLSEKDSPGTFETGPGEKHRIAKTELRSDAPIYVNVDALYDSEGRPALDYPTIVSILTHELGHQAGEADHAFLDIMGAKLKRALEQKMSRHEIDFGHPARSIEVLIINHGLPARFSEVIFSWEGRGSRKVTGQIAKHLKCRRSQDQLAGFEFVNGHYFYPERISDDHVALGFSFWAYVYCYSEEDNKIRLEKSEFRFAMRPDLNLSLLDHSVLP